MKFASRSAIESLSSANCGSSASRAKAGPIPLLCNPRKDDLEEGRSGVVGRDTGERDRARSGSRVCDAERDCSMFSKVSGARMLCRVIGVVFWTCSSRLELRLVLMFAGIASRASRTSCSLADVHLDHMTWNNLNFLSFSRPSLFVCMFVSSFCSKYLARIRVSTFNSALYSKTRGAPERRFDSCR